MKTHLRETWREVHALAAESNDSFLFAAIFVVGVPVVVFGIGYLVKEFLTGIW